MLIDNELLSNLYTYNHRRYIAYRLGITFDVDRELENKLCARYNKVSRIKSHLVYMWHRKRHLYFLTFTFNDKYINKCDRTKKDLIKNAIKKYDDSCFYILNVDYGSKNGRQHFHCILATDLDSNLDLFMRDDNNYPCFVDVREVREDFTSLKCLPKYINKLSNHCIKDSTKSSRIFFNFKGYGDLSVPEVRKEYILDLYELASLDKANVTGKIES